MDDSVNIGRHKKMLVSDLVKTKGEIFNLIKKGLQFDDEVLKETHIKKTIRDVRVGTIIVPHQKENKTYEKETESLKNIIKSLNTLDKQTNETFDNEELPQEEGLNNIYLDEEDE